MKVADPNYAYAWNGSNQRFNKLMNASAGAVKSDVAMADALTWAKAAWENKISDPSNGALFWDGLDFKIDNRGGDNKMHPKRRDGFKYGSPLHDIFNVPESRKEVIVRWKIRNRKTGEIFDGAERGRYDAVWVSTAAHGRTIFWKHPKDYLMATGGKEFR